MFYLQFLDRQLVLDIAQLYLGKTQHSLNTPPPSFSFCQQKRNTMDCSQRIRLLALGNPRASCYIPFVANTAISCARTHVCRFLIALFHFVD